MTTERDLIQRLADALTNAIRVIHNEDGTQHISTATPVLTEARAYLDQPEPEGLTDEELLAIAAASIDGYQDSGITVGEYEAETEGVVYSYGSDLIVFARALIAADRARWANSR